MRALLFLFAFSASASEVNYSPRLLDNSQVAFEKHHGAQAWLGMNVDYKSVRPMFNQVVQLTGLKLKNRGEAHITVVTPPEVNDLNPKIKVDEIDEIAISRKIQTAPIFPVCVKKGEAVIDGKTEKTFFVVVKSDALEQIREEIAHRSVARGGNPEVFKADHFFPHITLGFTSRDLFEQDGVIKDGKDCTYDVHPLSQ